jgi:peptidyl-prolyl cis-trans isomerase D
MLAFFRKFSKSPVANLFFVVLIVSFAAWGIKDVFHPRLTTAVVTAGSHEIQPGEFKQMFENYRRQEMQRTGQLMTPQQAVAAGVDVGILDQLSADEALAEFVEKLGLTPSETLVTDQIKKLPAFFDTVSGKFDQKAYVQVLAEKGMTPEKFEAGLRDDIAQNHLGAGLAAGLKQPLSYGALVTSFELEGRTISYFLLTPDDVVQPPQPTDQQLQAFIDQNHERLMKPETRVLTIVRFSAKALAPTMTPTPADLQKIYNFRKDSLTTPEKRSLVEIPARDAAAAQAIAARLQAGQVPDAVAKAFGVQPIVYPAAPKSAIADPKVADVAFQLAPGQVSGPVQTAMAGLAVVKVTGVTPAQAASFDALKPQLTAQAQTDLATQKVFDAVQKYDDAHGGGSTMAEAAHAAGAATVQLGPVSAQGVDAQGQPSPGLSPKLLKEAFALAQGGETDMEDDGAGEYFAVHVDKVLPPAVRALNEIRQPLTQFWINRELAQRMNARAEELAAKMRKGESLEAAAAEGHAQVGHIVALTRAALQQNPRLIQEYGQELAQKLFSAKAGDIVTGQTGQLPVMVARIDSVNPAAQDQAARMIVVQRDRASMQMFNDIGQLARAAAKAEIKPTYDLDRARSAMGVSPDDLPKTTAASGAKPARAN